MVALPFHLLYSLIYTATGPTRQSFGRSVQVKKFLWSQEVAAIKRFISYSIARQVGVIWHKMSYKLPAPLELFAQPKITDILLHTRRVESAPFGTAKLKQNESRRRNIILYCAYNGSVSSPNLCMKPNCVTDPIMACSGLVGRCQRICGP
jgi:hypothetical protein